MRKPIIIKNRVYINALQQIFKIMVNSEIVKDYEDYLEVTDGDKMAAAILVLASIRQTTEKLLEKAEEKLPEVGSFATTEHERKGH